jgi:hypothetical protein
MMLEIYFLAWNGHKNEAGLNHLVGSQPSNLDDWLSNGNCNNNKIAQTWIVKQQAQYIVT